MYFWEIVNSLHVRIMGLVSLLLHYNALNASNLVLYILKQNKI